MLRTFAHTGIAGLLAVALISSTFPLPQAHADELSELNAQVTASAQAYDNAVAHQQELADEIDTLDARIAELDATLPQQQKNCDASMVTLYKYSHETGNMVSLLLSAENLTDALALIDQYEWVIQYNTGVIEKTNSMKHELEDSRATLEESKAEADQAAQDAATALSNAQAARQKAQKEAAARQKAQEEAAAKAAEEAAAKAEQTGTEEDKQAAEEEQEAATTSAQTTNASNVSWSDDKTAFVNKWAPRINSYLAGSPMAGTGEAYAIAAWNNGVDPRWAPAISTVESSKGAACFASHNAWGYGGSGFSSWTEGINTIVAALGSSMYGGYLTRDAASTYCPPNSTFWYNRCAEEMAKI